MEVFSKREHQLFVMRMAKHLREILPEETADMCHDDLLERIENGIGRAKTFSIVQERDLEVYLEFDIMYGPEFGSTPESAWAEEILYDTEKDGEIKIQLLLGL